MKHPAKLLAIVLLSLAAIAAVAFMAVRYMDVLQKQFEFLRGLLAKHRDGVHGCCDCLEDEDGDEDNGEDSEEETEHFHEPDAFGHDELKF
jgi:hypothetical protein